MPKKEKFSEEIFKGKFREVGLRCASIEKKVEIIENQITSIERELKILKDKLIASEANLPKEAVTTTDTAHTQDLIQKIEELNRYIARETQALKQSIFNERQRVDLAIADLNNRLRTHRH